MEVASAVSAQVRTAVTSAVAGSGIEEKVGAAVDEGDVQGRVERALQTKLDSRVEESVAQGIMAAGIEGKVQKAVEEAGIDQRVIGKVNTVISAHIRVTVDGALAGQGIQDKARDTVDSSKMPGCVEYATRDDLVDLEQQVTKYLHVMS